MARKPSQPSGKPVARKGPTQTAAQQRLAAQRALAVASGKRAAARRRTALTVGAPIAVVVLVVVILVVVKATTGSNSPKSGAAASTAPTSVMAQVAGVPASVLNEVGTGGITTAPKTLTGPPLTQSGLPRVLFIGAEWCPYCAAERWPLAVALSRFGTLSGVGEVTSSPSDVDPNTATLSLHGATLSSPDLTLTAKELYSNQVRGNSYAPLDTLDPADAAIYTSHGGGFPFIDIGGKYLFSATYDPAILAGVTQTQIAATLANPQSRTARAIDGSANLMTAAICMTTASKPAAVCTSPGVTAAAALLPGNG